MKRTPLGFIGKVMWIWKYIKMAFFAYFCTLLGCFGDVPQTSVDDGDSHDVDMELEGNGVQDIYEDAFVIAYLQVGEILIRLTLKEQDHVVHRAK